MVDITLRTINKNRMLPAMDYGPWSMDEAFPLCTMSLPAMDYGPSSMDAFPTKQDYSTMTTY
jgi:hypothetical protein